MPRYDVQLIELTQLNAPAYLKERGWDTAGLTARELGGGVSNLVILIESPLRRAVLKQSLGRLRVADEWRAERDRIFREAAALRCLQGRVRGGVVPEVLFEDRDNFAFAMQAAPANAGTWKSRLLACDLRVGDARAAGTMLGSTIAATWNDPAAERQFGDQTVFRQLRIDPYYRTTARRNPEFAPHIERLVAHSASRRASLVHGDWSPKNLLCGGDQFWAIDWEVAHYGDPSFDVAFLLNHLLLKRTLMPSRAADFAELAFGFLAALRVELPGGADWVEPLALEHLPALLLARVDGKSPAEYLDEDGRNRARDMALGWLRNPPASFSQIFAAESSIT